MLQKQANSLIEKEIGIVTRGGEWMKLVKGYTPAVVR